MSLFFQKIAKIDMRDNNLENLRLNCVLSIPHYFFQEDDLLICKTQQKKQNKTTTMFTRL